ncbi:hypothetical protein P5673_023133 [Acropora cervicornis]|uniref:Uncharacterized protein n=1 Tax=Acropora cervicornis TaxID=6130 RepID=A0AAD9Q5K8_ACRCE|nr:hypothetical protein P5673_023133 [Acropora cervicornis]
MVTCVIPVEKEREQISQNFLSIQIRTVWRDFKIKFMNFMEDEKRTRADDSAKNDPGPFKICRTLEETKQIADLHFNPNKLTQAQFSVVAKGVKTYPVLNIEHSEHKVDATHARINVGKFCYKKIAGITQWNETADIKHHIEQATNQLNAHLKATMILELILA